MGDLGSTKGTISRHSFLKMSLSGISGTALLLLSGCLAGGGDNDEDDNGDDNEGEDD